MRRPTAAGLVALGVAAVAAFLPAVAVGFLSDDYETFSGVRAASGLGDVLTRHDLIPGTGSTFFRPLWMLFNWALYAVAGGNALAFHLASLALYLMATILLWVLARRLVGEPLAWIVAAGFALYPRHAEAVVWLGASTDLLATSLALAALVWMLQVRSPLIAAAGATFLAGAAAMAKETAFPLPVLALLILWVALPGTSRGAERWRRWTPLGMLGIDLVVFAVRYRALGGLGGYHGISPIHVVEAYGSLVVAAVTPAQLEIIRHPLLAVVPLAVVAIVAWGTWALLRSGDRRRRRIAVAGLGWFAVCLLPLYNYPVNLNTSEGERLLFLPSVGLMLAAAALLPPGLLRRPRLLLVPAVVGGALCLLSAASYVEATRIADHVIAQARALPARHRLLVLSFPEAYRNADVLASGLQAALRQSGEADITVTQCVPVLVRSTGSGAIAVRPGDAGALRASTTWAAPFVFSQSQTQTGADQCGAARVGPGPLGLGLDARLDPPMDLAAGSLEVAFFDGADLRPCRVEPPGTLTGIVCPSAATTGSG